MKKKTILTIATLMMSSYSFANTPFELETQSVSNGYETNIIVKSKADSLIIYDMIVNRGNCNMEIPAVYGVVSERSLKDALTKLTDRDGLVERAKRLGMTPYLSENDYIQAQRMSAPPQIGFGKRYTLRAGCKAEDILEVNIETNEGSWSFN